LFDRFYLQSQSIYHQGCCYGVKGHCQVVSLGSYFLSKDLTTAYDDKARRTAIGVNEDRRNRWTYRTCTLCRATRRFIELKALVASTRMTPSVESSLKILRV
jgi:hypothetical protein